MFMQMYKWANAIIYFYLSNNFTYSIINGTTNIELTQKDIITFKSYASKSVIPIEYIKLIGNVKLNVIFNNVFWLSNILVIYNI